MLVSGKAIGDLVKKIAKHFPLIKSVKTKIHVSGKDVTIKLRLVLWAGGQVPTFLADLQSEIQNRTKGLLGPESQIEVMCDVHKIDEPEHGIQNVSN